MPVAHGFRYGSILTLEIRMTSEAPGIGHPRTELKLNQEEAYFMKALGDSLGPWARAHRAHSFAGPKGPGPIGPFPGVSFDEVIGFSHL